MYTALHEEPLCNGWQKAVSKRIGKQAKAQEKRDTESRQDEFCAS